MRSLGTPQCLHCAHNTTPVDVPGVVRQTCKAYPAGIPLQILQQLADHSRPYPGDNGIRFEELGRSIFDPAPAT